MIQFWAYFRKGVFPDDGGLMDQPAKMLDAFEIMDRAFELLRKDNEN